MKQDFEIIRRRMTICALLSPVLILSRSAAAQPSPSPGASVLPATLTGDCKPRAARTPAQTEGPYFRPNSPARASLREAGGSVAPLVLTGQVLTATCQPLRGVMLDFWQADEAGEYDNRGHRFRGHQMTDDAGRYRLDTVLPGLYPGRTRHIHVKLRSPAGRQLTTQIYFPDEPGNARDAIYRRDLLARTVGAEARFDFVLEA